MPLLESVPIAQNRIERIRQLLEQTIEPDQFWDELDTWQNLTTEEHECLLFAATYCANKGELGMSNALSEWLIENLNCNDSRIRLSVNLCKLHDFDRAIALAEAVVKTARSPIEKLSGQHQLLASYTHLGAIPKYAARARFEYVGLSLMVERAIANKQPSEALAISPWWASYFSGKLEDRDWMEAAVKVSVVI